MLRLPAAVDAVFRPRKFVLRLKDSIRPGDQPALGRGRLHAAAICAIQIGACRKVGVPASAEEGLVAAASAAAATAAAREPAGALCRSAVAGAIRRAENGDLEGVLLPRALRASNLLRLVQDNLFEVRLAILTNVFVNRHSQTSSIF